MLVMSNRAVNEKPTDEKAFGEKQNAKGANELRLAHATKAGKKWHVEVVPEPKVLDPENLPSRTEYLKLRKKCQKDGKHALFFIHGFNKTFLQSLEQGHELEQRYGVEVVLFSWPSSPGGFATEEYRQARRTAQASFGALDAALDKIGHYMIEEPFDRSALVNCKVSFNFLGYSLGNYLFQHYVLSNDYARETRIFKNVVVCQADVDSQDHQSWVAKVEAGQRLYVTINENDKVLGFSENVNKPRLGKTLRELTVPRALYIDVTRGKGINQEHQIWGSKVKNAPTRAFFDAVFAGLSGEDAKGFVYDSRVNAFRL